MHGSESYQSLMNTWKNICMPMCYRDTISSAMEHHKLWYRFVWLFKHSFVIFVILWLIRISFPASHRLYRVRITWNTQKTAWIWICQLIPNDIFWIRTTRLRDSIQWRFTRLWNIFVSVEWLSGTTDDSLYATVLYSFQRRNEPTQKTLCRWYTET